MTRIVEQYPPNIRELRTAFELTGSEIFAWGPETIYNPSGAFLDPALVAHERVHLRQQGDEPEPWWDRYIRDAEFRLSQEAEAHRTEWAQYKKRVRNPKKRRQRLEAMIDRLSSKMYGDVVSVDGAEAIILGRSTPPQEET